MLLAVENPTPVRHPREAGGPACFEQCAKEKLGSRFRGNDALEEGCAAGLGYTNGECCVTSRLHILRNAGRLGHGQAVFD